eukprot:CAMPEP_0173369358 /NCGR_PEP_ID=MMETSP1144-20121109/26029_1 /TAXON_ID=483371 /ORGANISM="non described non described, Strain CCMP2298" /LENGTH=209 /DNA_ID=CAMNT_0014320675 /DNA_START=488 /DNA_END=1117 /DNA_ORIENTATION=+
MPVRTARGPGGRGREGKARIVVRVVSVSEFLEVEEEGGRPVRVRDDQGVLNMPPECGSQLSSEGGGHVLPDQRHGAHVLHVLLIRVCEIYHRLQKIIGQCQGQYEAPEILGTSITTLLGALRTALAARPTEDFLARSRLTLTRESENCAAPSTSISWTRLPSESNSRSANAWVALRLPAVPSLSAVIAVYEVNPSVNSISLSAFNLPSV